MVLRRGPKHPVIVVLVLNAIFEAQRKVHLRVVIEWNVLDRVEEVGALRRVCQKTPILVPQEMDSTRDAPALEPDQVAEDLVSAPSPGNAESAMTRVINAKYQQRMPFLETPVN